MMRRFLLLATIALVALGTAALIACGGGTKQEVATTPEETTSVAGAPAAAPLPRESGPPAALIQKALDIVAGQAGVDAGKLLLTAATTNDYPLSGETAYSFKISDTTTGKVYAISLDATGAEVDAEALQAGEEAAYRQKYGNLEAALFDELASASADKPVDVVIRLKEPPYEPPLRPSDSDKALTQQQVDTLLQQADQKRADAVATITKPALAALQDMGFKGTADTYDPVIYASLKPGEISKVEQLEGIDRIYSSPVFENTQNIARQAVHADVVGTRGMTGSGVKVAEIEVGGQINTDNPKLAGVVQDTTYSCLSNHAAAVAGIIRASFANGTMDLFGIAPDSSLWIGGSCNGDTSELEDRSTAAADWGALVFNLSLGRTSCTGMTTFDNFLDSLVSNRFRSVNVSAGNRGNSNCVTSPSLAYDVLSVGASADAGTADWSDDTVAYYSSAGNPTSTHNDREKPDVMAPGTDFYGTTNSSPWIGYVGSGTSYAAPIVTGITALLMQRVPTLQVAPAVVRAIIMATAAHNIEGDARLSGMDGVGQVVADWADDVVQRNSTAGSWSYMNYNQASANPQDWTISLVAGKPTRIVIAWDNDPDADSYLSQPGGDLDLQILDPSGNIVAGSASFDNSYEIAYFTPATAGHYKLRVIRSRWDQQTEMLAWAYFQGDPSLLPTPVPTATTSPTPTRTPTPRPATPTPRPATPTHAPTATPKPGTPTLPPRKTPGTYR